MEKCGFIYVWFDKKHKRYYVGRHWGTEDDGYICSSRMMRQSYKRRPADFKRRIVSVVYDKTTIVQEEQRWLDMIKKEELGTRYYNKTLKSHMPSMNGRTHSEETKRKMSEAAKGKPKSEEHKEKLRQVNLGKTYSDETNAKKGKKFSLERKKLQSEKLKLYYQTHERSVETRMKISENSKRLQAEGRIGTKGYKYTDEQRRRMSEAQKKRFASL